MSSFSGIQSALTALQAQRLAMEVTGQNIANANTAGYTRQRVDLSGASAAGSSSLQSGPRLVGDGVQVDGVTRLGDAFLTAKVNDATANNAYLGKSAETLDAIEDLIDEPSTTGLASALGTMWGAWSTAATSPTNEGARQGVLAASRTVVDLLHAGAAGVSSMWSDQRTQLNTTIGETNATSASIAGLNDSIRKAVSAGSSANDLMDQRDQLVTRLVELTGATTAEGTNGQVNVYLSGHPLVSDDRSWTVDVDPGSPGSLDTGGSTSLRLLSNTGGTPTRVSVTSGEVGAQLAALNTTIPGAMSDYDRVAASVADRINALHAGGITRDGSSGGPVFATTAGSGAFTARGLTLAIGDQAELALAGSGEGPTGNATAQNIADLGRVAGGPDALWSSIVVDVGTRTKATAVASATATSVLTTAVRNQTSSAGVSLDEETANLLIMQRAYEGAARVMTALDEALNTLINSTGRVGI